MSGVELLLNIAGGVALLLWGVRMVRTGMLRAFGSEFRRVLAGSLHNRLTAWLAGLGVTTILQSSTATATLAVSFASKGLLTTSAGLALMLGADLGSTLVVQLLSFNVHFLSPALILIGVVPEQKRDESGVIISSISSSSRRLRTTTNGSPFGTRQTPAASSRTGVIS